MTSSSSSSKKQRSRNLKSRVISKRQGSSYWWHTTPKSSYAKGFKLSSMRDCPLILNMSRPHYWRLKVPRRTLSNPVSRAPLTKISQWRSRASKAQVRRSKCSGASKAQICAAVRILMTIQTTSLINRYNKLKIARALPIWSSFTKGPLLTKLLVHYF